MQATLVNRFRDYPKLGKPSRIRTYNGEDIHRILYEVNFYRSQGVSLGVACCRVGICQTTYRRWRREHGLSA